MDSPTGILERMLPPAGTGMSTDLARLVLSMKLSDEDRARYLALSTRAQDGTLTDDERAELDEFLDVGDFVAILQSRARTTLGRQSTAA